MKVAYTAITGGKDNLRTDQNFEAADKFVAFLDTKPEDEKDWLVAPAHSRFKENNRNAKIHKILPHQYLDCDYSLWMDGTIALDKPLDYLIEKYLEYADIATFKHPGRDNIFDEAEACKKLGKGNPAKIDKQIAAYKADGYPDPNSATPGLFECTVILRRHTDKIEKLNNYWWSEISRHSRRDQLSFPYVVDKLGIKVATFEGTVYNQNDFCRKVNHLK